MLTYMKALILTFMASAVVAQLAGGWNSQTPDLEAMDGELKLFIKHELITQGIFGENESWSFKRILKHETQVVAGVNHILLLQMVEQTGRIKLLSLRVFQKLPFEKIRFEISEVRDLELNSNDREDISKDLELIKNLEKSVLRVHEYKSQRAVTYHIKKFNYAAAYKNEGIYNLNYLLEGTNNEIALYEHWLVLGTSNNSIRDTVYLLKLDLNASLAKSWSDIEKKETCEAVVSYLICLKQEENCSADEFKSQLKCSSLRAL